MKYYSRQRDQLLAARAQITSTVSKAKKDLLDPKLSVRQWIENLRSDTQPPKGYMLKHAKTRYRNTLRSFKINKLSQWLDEWEATMVECIKYDLPDLKNGHWLRDLADLIQPTSEFYYERFMEDADDNEQSDPKKFRSVARRLRERKDPPKGGRTVRGGAFHVGFGAADSSEEESEAVNPVEAEQAPPKVKGRKRSGTRLIAESKDRKKTSLDCPACGIRGHSLPECWQIFEELKPEGMKLSAYRVRKAKKTVEDDEELTAQVKEIRRKMEEKAKKEAKKAQKSK
jgi:hypothetical protein